MLDAELLAEVYLELIGARQAQLILVDAGAAAMTVGAAAQAIRIRPQPLVPRLSSQELEAHAAFVATLGENAIWQQYLTA